MGHFRNYLQYSNDIYDNFACIDYREASVEELISCDGIIAIVLYERSLEEINFVLSNMDGIEKVEVFDQELSEELRQTYEDLLEEMSEIGDEVLRFISSVIRTEINESDLAFRYGGEEFLIVFKTNVPTAYKTLSRILNKVRGNVFSAGKSRFRTSVTIGLAGIEESSDYLHLIAVADKKLYAGKKHGKNQVVFDQYNSKNM